MHAALTSIPQQFSSYFVTPAARLNVFSDQAVSPWVSFGGGFGHFGESSTLLFGGSNPGKTGTNTGVFQAGGGLDVRIFHRFQPTRGSPGLPVGIAATECNDGQ